MNRMAFVVSPPPPLCLLHHPVGVRVVLLAPVRTTVAGTIFTAPCSWFWHRGVGMIHLLGCLWLCLCFRFFLQRCGFTIHGQHVFSGPPLPVFVWIWGPQGFQSPGPLGSLLRGTILSHVIICFIITIHLPVAVVGWTMLGFFLFLLMSVQSLFFTSNLFLFKAQFLCFSAEFLLQ